MKVNNENFDKVLNKLVASTRSPRGRFTAENSWKLLESRLLKRRSMKRFWMRTASAAAVVLLCVTSWAAYQFLYVAPQREAIPTEAVHTTEETQVIHSVLTFDQQPLQEIVRQLSETFRTDIRIEGDSLKNYHMTAIIRKSKFPQNPKRSVRFSGKRTKRSVQKRKARNTQKAETKVL